MSTASLAAAAVTTGPVTARFDASVYRGNHHADPSAAIGYTLEDNSRGIRFIEEKYRLPYWVSNTHAEFDACIAALDALLAVGYTGHVNVCSDCQSVIELPDYNHRATPRSSLMRYYVRNVRDRLSEFSSYSLNHVRRENNAYADELASKAHPSEPSQTAVV